MKPRVVGGESVWRAKHSKEIERKSQRKGPQRPAYTLSAVSPIVNERQERLEAACMAKQVS